MIRIELGREVSPGIWEYRVPGYPIFGKSHQPLLDACRQIKLTSSPTEQRAGLFRDGSMVADISCPVQAGALLTVSEPSKGKIRFAKFREFDRTVFAANDNHGEVARVA